METLFIGGRHNGERHDVEPPMNFIQMPEKVDREVVDYAIGSGICNKVFMAEVYRREVLTWGGSTTPQAYAASRKLARFTSCCVTTRRKQYD